MDRPRADYYRAGASPDCDLSVLGFLLGHLGGARADRENLWQGATSTAYGSSAGTSQHPLDHGAQNNAASGSGDCPSDARRTCSSPGKDREPAATAQFRGSYAAVDPGILSPRTGTEALASRSFLHRRRVIVTAAVGGNLLLKEVWTVAPDSARSAVQAM